MPNPTDLSRKMAAVDPDDLAAGDLTAGLLADGSGIRAVTIDPGTNALRIVPVGGQLSGDAATGPQTYVSVAAEEIVRIFNGPGRLHRVDMIVPTAPGTRYLHVYDVPDGDDITAAGLATLTPVWRASLPNGAFQVTIGLDPGLPIQQGCVLGVSTTAPGYTTAGSIALYHVYFQIDLSITE